MLKNLLKTLSIRAAGSDAIRTRESLNAGKRLARESLQAARCDALADVDSEWFRPRASVAFTGAEAPFWACMDTRFLRSVSNAGGAL